MNTLKLNIDGVMVEAQEGMTVLQAARAAGLFIPSLCAHKELSPYGACRLCIVEIDGLRGTPTSCTTPAADGMVVRTKSPQLEEQRRRTLELMLSGHPAPCLTCDSREDCESVKKTPSKAGSTTRCGTCSNRPGCGLREAALGNFTREMGLPVIYTQEKIEKSDPFIDRDHNLCVLCGICYRVCEKVHGKPAISIIRRGKDAKIASAFDKDWVEGECTFCGACIDECPTATLSDRWSRWYGKEDSLVENFCPFCPKHCRIGLRIKDGRLIGTKMLSLNGEDALCAAGRFAYPQVSHSKDRLTRPYIKINSEMVPATWDETVEAFRAHADEIRGAKKKCLLVHTEMMFEETRAVLGELSAAMNSDIVEMPYNSTAADLPKDVAAKIEAGEYESAFILGNFLTAERAQKIPRLIVADFVKSPAQKFAEIVIPIAVLGEVGGTLISGGEKRFFEAVVKPSGMQRPVSGVLAEIFRKMNIPHAPAIKTREVVFTKDPTKNKADIPKAYLGHSLANFAADLAAFGLKADSPVERALMPEDGGYEIIEKRMLAPNFHLMKIRAPEMAKYVKPGQFAILMATMRSERSPFTVVDWNAEEGWVEFVIEELGRSSAELGALKQGDRIANLSGPLGTAMDVDALAKSPNALLLGGCYGIAAIYPLAKILKARGLKITAAIEASSSYMLFFEKELKGVVDELIVCTRDGSKGRKGGCSDVLDEIGPKFGAVISVGCVFMMKQTQKGVQALESALSLCALNPIMVDGTGMCGACRVSVAGETKFACVDGPFFNLATVDFDELARRRGAYSVLEVDALVRHKDGKCHS